MKKLFGGIKTLPHLCLIKAGSGLAAGYHYQDKKWMQQPAA